MANGQPGAPRHRIITLQSETDLAGFRAEARALLAQAVVPEDVQWHVAGGAEADLFGVALPAEALAKAPDPTAAGEVPATLADLPPGATTAAPDSTQRRQVPAAFLALCKMVVLHRDPGRFGLLYRLLWRLVHEPGLRHDPIDADRVQAELLAKAVRRDMHKMTAFVRFRTVHPQAWHGLEPAPLAKAGAGAADLVDIAEAADPPLPAEPLHVAWFEPEHHIVEAIVPFFVRRFTQMHWAILTPRRSVEWLPPAAREEARQAGELVFGPGAVQQDAPPADAGESLWLTYYANIFNPARLKLKMMQKEMPRRYWHNLPEARLIGELAARAPERSGTMIEQPTTTTARRIRKAVRNGDGGAPIDAPDGEAPVVIHAIADLKAATDRCRECPIGQYATQSVVGAGLHRARLMVVGEQPGDQEDIRGLPFVGPAGQLFDRALAQLGWPRDQLYVTNAVKHFKFELRGKRRMHKTPGQLEVAACHHWLEDELRLVQPEAILALGSTAARAVLGRPVAVMKERGQWHQDPQGRRVLVTLHPSALLRADPEMGEENFAHWLRDLSLATELAIAA